MNERLVKIDWLRIFSPAILGIIFSVIGVIISYSQMEESEGWSYIGVIILAPVIGILIVLDMVAKLIFKRRTLIIWIVELLILLLIYLFWIKDFLG